MGIILPILKLIQSSWRKVTVFLLLAIASLSLSPLPELPTLPGTDKTHHLIAYGCLALPAALGASKRLMLLLLFFVVFGGAIELIQPYVNRYGEWLDFVANTTGVALGAMIGSYLRIKVIKS